nr:TolC family protein [Ignavibacteriaceae bacterium]
NSALSAIDVIKSSYYPNINLQGSYNYNRPNQRIFPLQDKFYDTWDISLILSWDIWNWGQTGSQVEQARETYHQSKLLSEKLMESIEVEVFNDFSNKKELSKKISALMTSLQYAEEHLKTIKEKFDIQLATSTELIEAEVMLYQIKTELINTRADYEIAIAKLKKSAGLKL